MTDFVDAMETFLQSRLEDVHTMLPGVVQSYDPKTRTATVKPSVRLRTMHADILDIPPIASVPIVWPGSSTFSTMSKDLPTGSGVTLLFSEASIGNWQRGAQDADAEDETRHCLQDAIAVPGLWSMRRVPNHVLSLADWGMCNDSVEVGGTNAGKVAIKNQTTDLREVLEALQEILPTMDAHHVALNAYAPGYATQAPAISAVLTKIKGLLA